MPITQTALTVSGSTSDGTSYATASISPASNVLTIADVYNSVATGTPNEPTLSGCGLTWIAHHARTTGIRKICRFIAVGTATAGAVTISTGAQTQQGCLWSIYQLPGAVITGAGGVDAFVQNVSNNFTAATSATITIPNNLNSPTNAIIASFYHLANETTNAGSGFTKIGSAQVATPNQALGSQFRVGQDLTVDMSWATSSISGGLVAEIREASPTNFFHFL